MPWRIATGLSLIFWVVSILLIGDRLEYLEPYSTVLVSQYTLSLSLYLTTAIVNPLRLHLLARSSRRPGRPGRQTQAHGQAPRCRRIPR